jgi:hypothetical protein
MPVKVFSIARFVFSIVQFYVLHRMAFTARARLTTFQATVAHV